VGGAILVGGGALLLTVTVASSVLGLAAGLPACKGDKRRAPSDAEEIEKLAKRWRAGDLEDWEFRLAKYNVLGVPENEEDLEREVKAPHEGPSRDKDAMPRINLPRRGQR
jgi:hypothetical protein